MSSHDLSDDGVADRLGPVLEHALAAHGLGPGSAVTLLNVSENATFAVDDVSSGSRSILRVHRLGYHDGAAIESELAWLDAVRSEAGLRTPAVLPTIAGERVLTVHEDSGPRHVVRFEFLPGSEPDPADESLVSWFEVLGSVTARLHHHARHWVRPTGFRRFAWDYDAAFGSVARWGRWQDGIAVGPSEAAVLGRLSSVLQRRLGAFGSGPGQFGLIHADLRLANLLVHDDQINVIDFDDAGFGWYLYDFGSAVSFFEHDPRIPELTDAWVRGYRSAEPLDAAAEAEIPTFVMMRRLLLVAWIGSHAGTDLARSMGAEYTATSCDLAEQYLSAFA